MYWYGLKNCGIFGVLSEKVIERRQRIDEIHLLVTLAS